jgi:acetyltransferase-like isoleucine patch superfamily enzyme
VKNISEAVMDVCSEDSKKFREMFLEMIHNQENPFHPLVFVQGEPEVGKNVYIGLFSEVNARYSHVRIGDNCDIASFVSINVADSHNLCIGLSEKNERKPIIIENNVFIGSHCFIKGGAHIGHHSVIAAGTIVEGKEIPPFSFVSGNPMKIKKGYYSGRSKKKPPHHDTT